MQRGALGRAVALVAAVATLFVPAAGAGAATTTSVAATTTTTATALPPTPTTAAPVAWILVDADTGNVLDGVNIHTPEPPASIVKVMSALTALQRMPPSAQVTVSQNAVTHGQFNQNPSGMKAGQTWTVAQTIALMMIISANDAAYALAESTSGSVAAFANDETSTAHALGMRDSTFNDPAGLDDSSAFGGGPQMSPFDVAIAVRAALHVPAIADPAKTAVFDFSDPGGGLHHVANHNAMLPNQNPPSPAAYADATGFKTGSTKHAGSTFAATATRNGRTLIAVLLNCADRYNWAKALLDRGFLTPVAAKGIGETLPAVQDLTYTHRAAVKDAAVKFLTGTKGLGSGIAVPPSTTATSYRPVSTTVAKRPAIAAAKRKSAKNKGGGGGGLSAVEIVLIVLAVLLLTLVLLRRRAVRRQKARREARRQTQAALRRGSLPVVDGRYRAGMRTGKTPQSNVRVHRDRE